MRQCATEKSKDTWTSGTQQRPEIDPHTYGRFNGIIGHLFEKNMKLNPYLSLSTKMNSKRIIDLKL